MRRRTIAAPIELLAFDHGKMAFVSGPRQAGKTTLAKALISARDDGTYRNWDDVTFRRAWVKDPRSVIPRATRGRPLLVLDELHKARGWKRTLKGVYDTLERPSDILVTGSARLNVYTKGGDSLLGRYVHFRLHPFSLRELEYVEPAVPDDLVEQIRTRSLRTKRSLRSTFDALLEFGAFPEPFLRQDARYARIWRRGRLEKVIREDLRDLSRLPELSRIEMLAALLPERVGSPLSVAALRDDLEVSHDTVTRWLMYLRELYYLFELKPFRGNLRRSLRKEGKAYLWDHSEVDDPAARFETLVAAHLLKACHYWTDTGEGDFALHYVRDKEKREVDFLIVRDRKPWIAIEAKRADETPIGAWKAFLPALKLSLAIQVVEKPGVWRWHTTSRGDVLVASADQILPYFA
jgi:predicted AAA+ superfamily ATPase